MTDTWKFVESYKVVAIGSSLFGHGIKCTNKLLTASNQHKKINLQLTKIWFSGDPFKELIENTELIEELVLLKPDLICFQTELPTINLQKTDNFLLKKINNLSRINRKFIDDLTFKDDQIDSVKYGCNPIIYKNLKIDTLNIIPMNRVVKEISNLKFAFNGLLTLKKAKIKMKIVDIPRPQKIDININSETFENNLQELLKAYKQDLDIEYWKYTGNPMHFKHFVDGAHLNEEGSEIYTKWLIEKIETIIE